MISTMYTRYHIRLVKIYLLTNIIAFDIELAIVMQKFFLLFVYNKLHISAKAIILADNFSLRDMIAQCH